MEIIPVAITSAKYPGNRSAAAREMEFGGASFIQSLRQQVLHRIVCSRARDQCVRSGLLLSGPRCEWSVADHVVHAVDARTPEWRASDARRLDRNL